jgi:hypothetical protein
VNNAPTLSPADRLSEILLMLIQALFAQAGIKLPAPVMAMIEAQLRGVGENFARLAASVEKRQPAPPRRARRPRRIAAPRPAQAQKTPLPQWKRSRPARAPQAAIYRRRSGLRRSCGPPNSARYKPAPWHAHFVTLSE